MKIGSFDEILIGVCIDTYVFYQSVLEKKHLSITNLIIVYR